MTYLLTGGCLCKAITYTITAEPFAADYCHCPHCQKTAGAPVMAWMDIHSHHIQWHKKQPKEYASSKYVRRGFCSECGSTLTFRHEGHPDYLTLAIASLDEPERVAPTYHIYTDSQIPWFEITDGHPRFAQEQSG